MARVPVGKVLLRNVIRHTDAHNKIQEESEMWKLRGWEKQISQPKNVSATECMRGSMHCDRVTDYSRDQTGSRERASGHDDREARYWTRKLYEFEAGDPDRWGHSGFKELYPEEFESDCEEASGTKKNVHHKRKKSKRLKKSSGKKKKKKKKKKDEEEKRKRAQCSSGDGSSDESNTSGRCKQRRKRPKSKHKKKKTGRNGGREEGEESSSEGSDDEGERARRTHLHGKRKQDSHKGSESGLDSQKKRRKNWKGRNEENTDSSGD